MSKYKHVAVGGTFDRFHKGHESLLETAFNKGERITIGITSDDMVRDKSFVPPITSFEKRKKEVWEFAKRAGVSQSVSTVELVDTYGPLMTDVSIDAVVIGPHISKATVIKLERMLPVVQCRSIYAEDGSCLSSARIRSGEVDRKGALFNVFDKILILPKVLRSTLQEPLGKIIENDKKLAIKNDGIIITVGDESTRRLFASGILPHLAIVDMHVKRRRVYKSIAELGYKDSLVEKNEINIVQGIPNRAGSITPLLFQEVKKAVARARSVNKKTVIVVDGEDDLTTLACIQCAPLETVVLYGQPRVGVVRVVVSEEKKVEVRKFLSQFKQG